MRFAWDQRKSDENLEVRGFDFAFAARIFDGPILVRADRRQDYGEERLVALGMAAGVVLAVDFTDRPLPGGVVRRIISARRSNARERQAFQNSQED